MKKIAPIILTLAAAALVPKAASAGQLTYVPITGDSDCGIDGNSVYTNAAKPGADQEIGGIKLSSLHVDGWSASGSGVIVKALTGTLKETTIAKPEVAGQIADALSSGVANDGAEDGSQQEIALDPQSLETGKTYDLRIYIAPESGASRSVNLSFAGDGKAPAETGYFDENDATTSIGKFSTKSQPYYIDYRFVWDGQTTPGVIVNQKSGANPFQISAVVNVEAEGAGAAPERSSHKVASKKAKDVGVESDEFYGDESLNNHGEWVALGGHGTCWHPTDVGPDWRPYTRGHWVHSDADGWVWASAEDFGWATDHYGRWCNVEGTGWCWVPGSEWAPAWVSWRAGDDYAGWAPLPPDVECDDTAGVGEWVDDHYGIGPDAYVFCKMVDLSAQLLSAVLVRPDQNVSILKSTTNVTNIVNNNNAIFVGGPSVTNVNSAIAANGGTPVPTVKGVTRTPAGGATPTTSSGLMAVRGPAINPRGSHAIQPKIAKRVNSPVIDKGWNGIKDPMIKKSTKQAIAQQTAGKTPQNAPAKAATTGTAQRMALTVGTHRNPSVGTKSNTGGSEPSSGTARAGLTVGKRTTGNSKSTSAGSPKAATGGSTASAPQQPYKQGGKFSKSTSVGSNDNAKPATESVASNGGTKGETNHHSKTPSNGGASTEAGGESVVKNQGTKHHSQGNSGGGSSSVASSTGSGTQVTHHSTSENSGGNSGGSASVPVHHTHTQSQTQRASTQAAQNYTPQAQTYTPPKRTYTPPAQTYTPPVRTYTPPAQTYTPPVRTYTPPAPTYTPPARTYPQYGQPANTFNPYMGFGS